PRRQADVVATALEGPLPAVPRGPGHAPGVADRLGGGATPQALRGLSELDGGEVSEPPPVQHGVSRRVLESGKARSQGGPAVGDCARNCARGHPEPAPFHPTPGKSEKKTPSVRLRLTEGSPIRAPAPPVRCATGLRYAPMFRNDGRLYHGDWGMSRRL